jgi:hypothetical protein
VDGKEIAELKYVKPLPGMPALVVIPTGERTALDYLLRPLTESVLKSFRKKIGDAAGAAFFSANPLRCSLTLEIRRAADLRAPGDPSAGRSRI